MKNLKAKRQNMNYTIEKDEEDGLYTASTKDYPGIFFGYGKTKEEAIEDLRAEVEFALNGGYNSKNLTDNE